MSPESEAEESRKRRIYARMDVNGKERGKSNPVALNM